ncbi:hypothetical protein [Qingshengfaniella alkalisoli]|uniref:Uncharacterized protein n=1 Tax=Qingshengfaniella alkalisoli TaxID=2599296 RepID=A0A5B8J4G9_9RHOB|nr:hypothetical protein [Qingshengfaniella alkalisoli]QDY69427.1 hypothetical protein FPZ52_07170 [Qingshengfaniella alkalisoli]
MSASETNTEKQAKRHSPALIGIGIAVAIGVIIAVVLAVSVAIRGNDPGDQDDNAQPVPTAAEEVSVQQ